MEEFAAVEERLRSDAGFRERYLRAIDVEAGLYESFSFPGTFSVTAPRKKSPAQLFTIAATCAIVLVGFTGWIFWPSKAPLPPPNNGNAANLAAGLKLLVGLKPVAIVTHMDQVAERSGSDLKPGMRIKPGVVKVASGQVQLEFLNGAQVNIEGPAELHLLSVDAATLTSGKAAARVPPGARGFVLNTPGAAIVDMGTEFAVAVDKGGESEVYVVEGAVDVSLLGKDGNTFTFDQLTETEALRVTRNPARLERIVTPHATFPGIQAQTCAPLKVSDVYVRSILESRPAIYWRFETLVDGRVPNEVSPRFSGVVHLDPEDPSAIVVQDGVARFTPANNPRRIEPDEPIPGFNHESFTIELWASPDKLHWATFVSVVPEESVERNKHLALLEFPYKCSLVYPPGSFRFLQRHPPETNGGTNLFTNGDCTPGLWHHLAAVKSPEGMKLFLNGKAVRQFADPVACDEDPYRVMVGQLYEGLTDRQLSGVIDEFAVYLRALKEAEISEHYRAMIANQSN